jgi:hypothetical protein
VERSASPPSSPARAQREPDAQQKTVAPTVVTCMAKAVYVETKEAVQAKLKAELVRVACARPACMPPLL